MIVVDANVALFWTIKTPLSGKAAALLRNDRRLIAPDLIIAEVTNALFTQVRNRLEAADRAKDGLDLLPRWFAELVPSVMLRSRAFDLALELKHPAYDCFYLALALMRDVLFVTSDAHFQRKAAAAGYGDTVVLLEDWAQV
jgi:predicted nucleic acid-binding protein